MTAGSVTAAATALRCSTPRSGSTGRGCAMPGGSTGARRSPPPPRGCAPRAAPRRRSSAMPPTRRATCCSASCARRLARPTSTPAPRAELPGARRWSASQQPELSARVSDIDDADAILVLGTDPLHSSPILDLRIRKAIRRNGARLAVATERPTALDGGAEAVEPLRPRRCRRPPVRTRGQPARRGGGGAGDRDRRDPARRGQGGDRLGRAARTRGRGRARGSARSRRRAGARRGRGLGPARNPRPRQRPRPARGRLPSRRRPWPDPLPRRARTAPRRSAPPWSRAS